MKMMLLLNVFKWMLAGASGANGVRATRLAATEVGLADALVSSPLLITAGKNVLEMKSRSKVVTIKAAQASCFSYLCH